MQYRPFGSTGLSVSAIGFGGMRLPTDTDRGGEIVSRAIDLGINFFETSTSYCSGTSEVSIGKGVRGRRDKVIVSSKSSARKADGIKRDFEQSLRKMNLEKFDFYNVWCLMSRHEVNQVLGRGGALQGLRDLQRQGLVDHIGFTSHQSAEDIIEVIDTGEFEMVVFRYHLLRRDTAAVIPAARARGMGTVVMTPLGGGTLGDQDQKLRELTQTQTSAEVALRYLLAHDVSTVIPGIGTMQHLALDARIGDTADEFTDVQARGVDRIIDELRNLDEEFCTWCNYCMPCPHGVNIPYILDARKKVQVYDLVEWAEDRYRALPAEERADRCTECGDCEEQCPNRLPIMEQLAETHRMLGDA